MHNTIRKQQHDLSEGSVPLILSKKLWFHSYKVKLEQELNENDPDRCLQFSEMTIDQMDTALISRIFS